MGHQLPDELVYQILLRLPAASIFRFKSVSKDWNRLLSHHQFRLQYLTLPRYASSPLLLGSSPLLLGFFQFKPTKYIDDITQDHMGRPHLSFLPTCNQGVLLNPLDLLLNPLDFIQNLGFFFASSGGLILGGRHPSDYYIYNPITYQRRMVLPRPNKTKPPTYNRSYTIGFYCEQQLDHDHPRYKIVRTVSNYQFQFSFTDKIETYSSETCVWRDSTVTGPMDTFSFPLRTFCLAIKGTFFWYNFDRRIAAYDPDSAEDRLWLITVPEIHRCLGLLTLGESADGRLQCVKCDDVDIGCRIYVLAKKLSCYLYSTRLEVNEWNLNHVVRVHIPACIGGINLPTKFEYLCPLRIAFHPLNSRFLYFRMGDIIFLCDTWSGRVNLVPHCGTLFPISAGYDLFPLSRDQYSRG